MRKFDEFLQDSLSIFFNTDNIKVNFQKFLRIIGLSTTQRVNVPENGLEEANKLLRIVSVKYRLLKLKKDILI